MALRSMQFLLDMPLWISKKETPPQHLKSTLSFQVPKLAMG